MSVGGTRTHPTTIVGLQSRWGDMKVGCWAGAGGRPCTQRTQSLLSVVGEPAQVTCSVVVNNSCIDIIHSFKVYSQWLIGYSQSYATITTRSEHFYHVPK